MVINYWQIYHKDESIDIVIFLWVTILVVVIVINYKKGQNIVIKCNKNVKECEIVICISH